MGTGQAINIGLRSLDMSSWIGVFSGGVRVDDLETHFADLIADPVETNRKLNLMWISAGDKESARVPRFLGFLTAHHIQHEFHLVPGEHTFINWRRCLHLSAQQLFHPQAARRGTCFSFGETILEAADKSACARLNVNRVQAAMRQID
jgi:hypothetical protein